MGTAFLVFYFTIQYEKNKEKKKLQVSNRNRIFYLSSLVTSSIKNIEDVIESLKLLIMEFEKDELSFNLLIINPNYSFDRIYELLKNESYFLAYMECFGNNVIKEFNNISLEVDYFKMQIEQLSNMHKSAQTYDYERKKQFKANANDIMNISVQLILDNDIDPIDREFIDLSIKEFYLNHPKPEREGENLQYYYAFIRKILEKGMKNYYRVLKYNNYLIFLKDYLNPF